MRKCYVRLSGSFKKKYDKMIFFSHRKDLCMSVAFAKTCQVKPQERRGEESDGDKGFWRMQERVENLLLEKSQRLFFGTLKRSKRRERILEIQGCFEVEGRTVIGIFIRWLLPHLGGDEDEGGKCFK